MLAALRQAGAHAVTLSTDHGSNPASLRAMRADVVVVDTIAARAARPIIRALRANGARIVTLALMSKGAAVLARDSDRAIAVSLTIARELYAAGIPRARVAVVAPGTSRASGPAVVDPRRRARRSLAREVRVLCVANWSPAKGIHTLLAAARAVPGIAVDLVGAETDPAYARRVRAAMAHPALAKRVRAHGALTGARLERMYRTASVFALPSTVESYGMAVSEALAHGVPVIACDIPATREVVGRAALLVAPRRVGPLAEALRALANDERQRNRLARRARARSKQLPTWQRSERELVRAVLREVSGRDAGARRTPGGRPS
jgi:glycosyltransferase involved in cell wall biosynthesis